MVFTCSERWWVENVVDSLTLKMKDKVFLAFPTVPADVSAAGAAEYTALLQRNKLDSTHAAAQASAMLPPDPGPCPGTVR